jgi:hypothetical protein
MLLSKADIALLTRRKYSSQEFVCHDKQGYVRLRNHNGYCFFYDAEKQRCRAYQHRPLGCRIYPVIYSEEEGTVVDDLCPMKDTVSKTEIRDKSGKLIKLLRTIDDEAKRRKTSV